MEMPSAAPYWCENVERHQLECPNGGYMVLTSVAQRNSSNFFSFHCTACNVCMERCQVSCLETQSEAWNPEYTQLLSEGCQQRSPSLDKSFAQAKRETFREKYQFLKEMQKHCSKFFDPMRQEAMIASDTQRYLCLNGQGILPVREFNDPSQREAHLEYKRAKDRERYHRLKALGSSHSAVMDPLLREAKRERDRQRYQRLKEEGRTCGREFKDPVQREAYLQRKRAKDRERYHRLKELGQGTSLLLSPAQREAKRERDRQRYRRLKEQGLLPTRGFKDPVLQEAYLQRKRERDRQRYLRLGCMDPDRREMLLQRKRERDRARYWRMKMELEGTLKGLGIEERQREARRERDRIRYQRLKESRLQQNLALKLEPGLSLALGAPSTAPNIVLYTK